jgi:hypothetical protein
MGARTAALEKGRRKRAAFMLGYLEFCGSARCCGDPIGKPELARVGIDALDEVFEARGDERRWCCGRGRFGGVAIVVRKSSHSCDPGTCRVRATSLAVPQQLRIFPTTTSHALLRLVTERCSKSQTVSTHSTAV